MSPSEFHSFFDVVPAPVALLDSEFCFIDLNRSFKTRICGPNANLIGAHSLEVFQPTPKYTALLSSNVLTTGEISSAQVRCKVSALGLESVNADVRIAAINDLEDRQYLLTLDNVGGDPELEPKPTSRDELFRSWIDQSSLSISVQDSNYNFAIVNEAYCKLVGYSAEELIGRDPIDLLHPPEQSQILVEQRGKLLNEVPEAVPGFSRRREILHRSGRRVQFRLELIRVKGPDGSMLWCSTLIDPQLAPSDSMTLDADGSDSLVTDVSGEAGSSMANLSPDAMIAVDLARERIVRVNAAAAILLALDDQPLVGVPIDVLWSRVRSDQQARLGGALRSIKVRGAGRAEQVVELPLEGSEVRTLRFRFSKGQDPALEALVVVEDVTALRSNEQVRVYEEREQRKMLVRETHHRIKNNLQGVAGLIERASYRQPALKPGLDNVILQIRSIATVHGLQIESDNQVDLSQLARAVAESIFKIFGFRVNVSVKSSRPNLKWSIDEHNAVPVALAISELLTNATKHGAQPERVRLAIELGERRAAIRVTNAGSLPQWFSLKHGAELLGGLKLIKALLPREGCELDYSNEAGAVCAELKLSPPAIVLVDSGNQSE